MKLRQSLRISWRSITAHKLRSTLTTLGVILGIAAVIMFMVLGGAFTEDFIGDIEEDTEPEMEVVTQTSPPDGVGFMIVQAPIYTESDIEAVEAVEGVSYATPQGDVDIAQVDVDGESVTGIVDGVATTGERLEDLEMVEGEPQTGENETVLNVGAANLFEEQPSEGEEIDLTLDDGTTRTVTVAGIVDDDPGTGQMPARAYLPVEGYYNTTIETPDGDRELAYPSMVIRADDFDVLDDAQDAVIDYMNEESHAAELKQDDDTIQVQTMEDAIEQFSDIVDQLTIFIAAVAGIALVVGSIGIANIMIVSVTERTREIGIMKAVGARRRDIMQLFLVESVILGIIGAFLGVIAGLGLGFLGVTLLGWPMVYPLDWVIIAVVIGVGVGILSGVYPAWRAARTDPIEALRHE